MTKKEAIVTLINICGLLGKHEFVFNKGLNVLVSRNALGVSSVMNGIACALGMSDGLQDSIHALASEATASIKIGDLQWSCHLVASETGVEVAKREPSPSSEHVHACVVNEKHPLSDLNDEAVRSLLRALSGVDAKESEMRALSAKLTDLQTRMNRTKVEKNAFESQLSEYATLSEKKMELEVKYNKSLERMENSQGTEQGKDTDAEALQSKLKAKKGQLQQAQQVYEELLSKRKSMETKLELALKEQEEKQELRKLSEARETKVKLNQRALVANNRRALFGAYKRFLTIVQQTRHEVKDLKIGSAARVEQPELKAQLEVLKQYDETWEECPLCAAFKKTRARCLLQTIPIETRIATFGEIATDEQRKQKLASAEVTEALNVIRSLEPMEAEASIQIGDLQKGLKELSAQINEAEKVQEQLQGDEQKLDRDLFKLNSEAALRLEATQVKEQIRGLDAKLAEKTKLQRELRAKANEFDEYKDKLMKAGGELKEAQTEHDRRLHAARIKFNAEVSKIMREVGFKGFVNIEVTEKFQVKVMRKVGGREFEERLTMLSTSERTAMIILLALVAKLAYLPDAPIFAVDTISTSFDPKRFANLVDYMKDRVQYLIITLHSPQEAETIKVMHTFPA